MRTSKARQLRKHPTDAERLLWMYLRYRQINGHKFRRQRPIGQYVADSVCPDAIVALVNELDGGQYSQRIAYDAERTALLASQEFQVLRFWDNQVLLEIASVKTAILQALESPPS